jgi:hypothetical protein
MRALVYDRDTDKVVATVTVKNGRAVVATDNPHIKKWLKDLKVRDLDADKFVTPQDGDNYVKWLPVADNMIQVED